jgi:D-psicose/D-tagatose/L-ribulose 3-epimerase
VAGSRDIYLSFFMFTTNLQPGDPETLRTTIQHIRELSGQGYTGFDMPIFPSPVSDHGPEVEAYAELRRALDAAGLSDVAFTTNVAATKTFDPSSPYAEQRQAALSYLTSRIDITAALGGSILGGPIVLPYNQYPTMDFGDPIWSDALQEWARPRYESARPILEQAGEHAERKGVRLAIEPVDHWETSGPNLIGEVRALIEGVRSQHVGACVDSAHVVLGSSGPEAFVADIAALGAARRVHYVQVSAPDRGAIKDSWIPWDMFLGTVLPVYDGPLLIEVFNAIPAFLTSLHLTRRKFWIPGEDSPVPGVPDAYTVAGEGFDTLIAQLQRFDQKGSR